MQHCGNGNDDDYGIRNFDAKVFAVSARLEKIIGKTVYCKSAIEPVNNFV